MKRHIPTWFIVALSSATSAFIVLSLVIGLVAWAEDSELDTDPRVIPYNGVLEFNGQALNGEADIKFSLVTDDGTCAENFVEDHENVPVYAGRFSVNIGSVTQEGDLPNCLFNAESVHLQMAVRRGDDDTDHILLAGRQRINPVPFSYWAAEGSDFRVDGAVTSNSIATDSIVTGSIATNSITTNSTTIANTMTAGRLELTDSDPAEPMLTFSSDSYDSDANVGEFSDYKLLLYPNSTPETSYGFGIQGGTLFANTDATYDFKVDGVDKMVLDETSLTVFSEANIHGNINTGNVTVQQGTGQTSNVNIVGTNTFATLNASARLNLSLPGHTGFELAAGDPAGEFDLLFFQRRGNNGPNPVMRLTEGGNLSLAGNVWDGATNYVQSQHKDPGTHGHWGWESSPMVYCPEGQFIVGFQVNYTGGSSVGSISFRCRSI